MKRHYNRSFAKRLSWRITLALLVAMGISSYLVFIAGESAITESECEVYQSRLRLTSHKVAAVMNEVAAVAANYVPAVEESLDRPDRLADIMKQIVELNPHIQSCGLCFVADYYPQKGRWFCPYARLADSTSVKTSVIGGEDYDYLNSQWFKEALRAKRNYWSEPFFEGNGAVKPLVSYLIPIRNKQGATVAVLGADLSLEWLKDYLGNLNEEIYQATMGTGKDSEKRRRRLMPHSFIVNRKGVYVAHPDERNILRGNILDHTADTTALKILKLAMAGQRSDYFEDGELLEAVEIDNGRYYIFHEPLEHIGWTIVMTVPRTAIDLLGILVGVVLSILIAFGVLMAYIVGRIFIRRSVKPLKELAHTADEVAKGNFAAALPAIKSHDEISLLRDSFERMQRSLGQYTEQLRQTTAQKAAIENELKIAHDIQMSMLPKTFPPYPDRQDLTMSGLLLPAKAVGGDLFDFYIREDKLFFCIGDVSGKGVPAALVMAVTRSLFRNVSAHEESPENIVSALNCSLSEGNETNMFVTLFVGVVHLDCGRMLYCNAGHNQPLLVGSQVSVLPCDPNLPVGVMADWKFTLQEATIDKQTTVFLYTDGLSEAENAARELFGDERVMQVARQSVNDGKSQPAELISGMQEGVGRFVAGAEQSDDLTMLAIRCGEQM